MLLINVAFFDVLYLKFTVTFVNIRSTTTLLTYLLTYLYS